jgi:anthranilate phosphoribosyltransferase
MADFNACLEIIKRRGSLGREGAREAMGFLVSGEAADAQITAFLEAVNKRGVIAEELVGFAEVMRGYAVKVSAPDGAMDTCGTGGDGLQSFNFSTAAAMVAAGAGAKAAKHGNRSVSSKSGSADLLEAAGVAVDAPADMVTRSIEETGFGFMFAPRYHPAMKHVAAARKAMGVRTVFNLIGPLCNPAFVKRQVVGIYDEAMAETYAHVFASLGSWRVMVVHGEDGMDEMTLAGATNVIHVEDGRVTRREVIYPEDVGLKRTRSAMLKGSEASENARLLDTVLQGTPGPLLDGTLYNAGAALLVAGLAGTLHEGVAMARESVFSGRAHGVLWKLQTMKREVAR